MPQDPAFKSRRNPLILHGHVELELAEVGLRPMSRLGGYFRKCCSGANFPMSGEVDYRRSCVYGTLREISSHWMRLAARSFGTFRPTERFITLRSLSLWMEKNTSLSALELHSLLSAFP